MTEPSRMDPAAVVRAVLGAAYGGDLAVLAEHPGLGALAGALPKVFEAFPDLRAEYRQHLAEGERVAIHWTLTGTHTGPFFGLAPTGKAVRFQNVAIARVVEGRIVQFNSVGGWLAVFLQLGALPFRAPSDAPG
ncbi:MAG: ester cyclase [Gemmatimonadaceae bacterium]